MHVAIILVGLLWLSGCPRAEPLSPEAPLRLEGVPTIRVLIASGRQIRLGTSGPYALLADGREVVRSMDSLPEGTLTRDGTAWSIHAATHAAKVLVVAGTTRGRQEAPGGLGAAPSCVRLGASRYRGKVVFHPYGEGGILAVNHVNLESYLAGVLSRELLPYWHIRTYEAQAIAARTYALYEMSTVGRRKLFDVHDDQSSQVYGGFLAETDKSWRAVRATHGIVLAAGEKGQEKIFRAHYSACCGGMSNSVYVLYGPPVMWGPLVGGQTCNDCRGCSRYRWPPVSVPKHVIHHALGAEYTQVAELPGVSTIEVVEELRGRPVWVDVVSPDGRKVRLRADDLRLALLRHGRPTARGLYSMNCRIRDAGDAIVFDDGRGFGHGVGLCQWGAQAKAESGAAPEEILAGYYPTAKLFQAY